MRKRRNSPMSLRPWRDITRRKSRQIMVGNVPVGGDAPVTVQTMTNTPTSDATATIDQIRRCEDAGVRSEEHTSELQSLMRISYAVFCLKKKQDTTHTTHHIDNNK